MLDTMWMLFACDNQVKSAMKYAMEYIFTVYQWVEVLVSHCQ